MNRKIIVSEYENGRPCVEVVSDSGEGFATVNKIFHKFYQKITKFTSTLI